MQDTILSISGRPGLFRLVSRGNRNLIVETLDETHKRVPAFATDRITSLSDIAIYTESEDVPLMNVLATLRDKEAGKSCSINYRKVGREELRQYFATILPDFDDERVRDNDIKKLLSWYDILVKNGITDFEDQQEEEARDSND